MNKAIFSFSVLLILFFTCGCTRDVYTLSIDQDNNISVSSVFGIKKEFFKESGINENIEEFEAMKKDKEKAQEGIKSTYPNAIIKDAEITLNNSDEYFGFTQKKEKIAFDQFTSDYLPLGLKMKENELIQEDSGFIKNKYSIHLEYNDNIANYRYYDKKFDESYISTLPEQQRKIKYNDDGSITIEQISKNNLEGNISLQRDFHSSITLPEKPDTKVIIKLPVKATKTNATKELDDNTYEWDLFQENTIVDIYIEYEKYNGTLKIIAIFAAIIVLFIFGGVLYTKNINDIGI